MALDTHVGTTHTRTSGVVETHPALEPIGTQNQTRRHDLPRRVLRESVPLLWPIAHDARTGRDIELAGYPAGQIGGFSLVGS
jgi:hypothetical protein